MALFLTAAVLYILLPFKQAGLRFEACILVVNDFSFTVMKTSEAAADRICMVRLTSSSTGPNLFDADGNEAALGDFAPGDIVDCQVDSLIQYTSPPIYPITHQIVKSGMTDEALLQEGLKKLPLAA